MSEGDQLSALRTLISLLQLKIVNLESGRINDDQLEDFAENFIPLQYRKLCYDLKCAFPLLPPALPPAANFSLGGISTSNISSHIITNTAATIDKVGFSATANMNTSTGTNSLTSVTSIATHSSSAINTPLLTAGKAAPKPSVSIVTAALTTNANTGIPATGSAATASTIPSISAITSVTASTPSASSLLISVPTHVGRKRKMSLEIPDGDNKQFKSLESTPLSASNSKKNSNNKDNTKDNSQLSSSSPGKTSSRKLRGSSIDDDAPFIPNGLVSGKKNKGKFFLVYIFVYECFFTCVLNIFSFQRMKIFLHLFRCRKC